MPWLDLTQGSIPRGSWELLPSETIVQGLGFRAWDDKEIAALRELCLSLSTKIKSTVP